MQLNTEDGKQIENLFMQAAKPDLSKDKRESLKDNGSRCPLQRADRAKREITRIQERATSTCSSKMLGAGQLPHSEGTGLDAGPSGRNPSSTFLTLVTLT